MNDIVDDILAGIPLGSARGRKAAPLHLQVVRPLTEADAAVLMNPPEKGISTPPLAKLRDGHHYVARLLADGHRPGEIALITGRSLSNISILQNDPAFKELVEVYRTQKNAVYLDVHERLAVLGRTAVAELQERLEETPESFTNPQLLSVVETTMDRTDAPPKAGAARAAGGPALPSLRIEFVGATPPAALVIEGTPAPDGP